MVKKRHQVERRGAMSGGYNDRRQSRVALARHRKESEEKRRETKQEYNNAVASREEAEQRLHNASTDIEKLKSKGENSERARKDAQVLAYTIVTLSFDRTLCAIAE